jgi:hypothetical protein
MRIYNKLFAFNKSKVFLFIRLKEQVSKKGRRTKRKEPAASFQLLFYTNYTNPFIISNPITTFI